MRFLPLLLSLLVPPSVLAQAPDTSRVYRLAQLVSADRLEERVSIQEVRPEERATRWFQFEAAYPLPLDATDAGWLRRLEPGGATSYQVTYVNPSLEVAPDAVADAAARIVRRHLPDAGAGLDVRRVYVVFREERDGRFDGERVLVR